MGRINSVTIAFRCIACRKATCVFYTRSATLVCGEEDERGEAAGQITLM